MAINNIIDKLNNELENLNKLKGTSSTVTSFFTDNLHFNDDFSLDDIDEDEKEKLKSQHVSSKYSSIDPYSTILPNDIEKSLVKGKEHRLIDAQNMIRSGVRISLKSFLISISLSFLNLFI